jgi:membrane protein involved in colicin uptake
MRENSTPDPEKPTKIKTTLLNAMKKLQGKPRLIFEVIGIILVLALATASSSNVPQEDYDSLKASYDSLQEDYSSLQEDYDDAVSGLKLANTSLEDTRSEYDEYKEKMQAFNGLTDEELETVSSRVDQTLAEKAAEDEARKKAEEEAAAQAAAEAQAQAEAQAAATQAQAEAQATETNQQAQGQMVWIPRTGSKYHSNSSCSNMKNPTQVSLSEAQAAGYEPCKKCY